MSARIVPAAAPFAPEMQKVFDAIMPPGVPPLALFTTLARNPQVYAKFRAGSLLDKGTLSLREREIVIDRTCACAGSEYEWGVHIAFFAERAGLSSEQVAATVSGDLESFAPRERLLIRLVDALHEHCTVEAALWSELKGAFSDEQLLELIALCGFYRTVAYFTNTLALPLEPYAMRFPV